MPPEEPDDPLRFFVRRRVFGNKSEELFAGDCFHRQSAARGDGVKDSQLRWDEQDLEALAWARPGWVTVA
ncbi:hypothetical protein AWC25_16700 [Mycobacterium sherrisii]|uniref:Uncharacterized protein n=1 Tax=Mycobacterium sherrisii TaxID=243061 RepID=A0A1E3SXY8_9MYCO|nr:hypothetical protein BHQ21_09665 [Mycobacterium sherrisii]ORW74380.1 hypothetical protein AWC25_16700 [Mycobacterium sherrisii]